MKRRMMAALKGSTSAPFMARSHEKNEPAAKYGAPPQEQSRERKNREDGDERIDENEVPSEVREQGVDVRDHIDHRELGPGVPAQPDQGPTQEADANPTMQARTVRDEVLQEQDHGECG